MKMKNNTKATLIALTSALLIFAASSCQEPKEPTPTQVCEFAKFAKDSTIKAGTAVSTEVNL